MSAMLAEVNSNVAAVDRVVNPRTNREICKKRVIALSTSGRV